MRAFVRTAAALVLAAGLAACSDGPLAPSPNAIPTAGQSNSGGIAELPGGIPGDTITAGEGECSLVFNRQTDTWDSECPGISGGTTLPPAPPPPPPPSTFPPPEPLPEIGGGGTAEPGSQDGINPLCAGALVYAAKLQADQAAAQDAYMQAYQAYAAKHAEYVAWDTQAKGDGIYTLSEQMRLIELGDQLHALQLQMNAAKEAADEAARAAIAGALFAGAMCAL
ncbi:MAG TPA: hypothetical protein VHG51_16125 [Longimicrobiaceae bacterium]|nr:hypothetical protein [Longimicrobiaceae bacterium]